MDLFIHILEHALEDTVALVPFLFVTYLVLETLEHAAADRAGALVRRAGAAGPIAGALLGVVPQCGFSAMGATFYAGRVVTLGTLVAVFLSTSDEMLPLLVAEKADAGFLIQVLAVKALIAAVAGVLVDALLRTLKHNARAHAWVRGVARGRKGAPDGAGPDLLDNLADSGTGTAHIHELCEHDHCGCDDDHEGAADGLQGGRCHGHGAEAAGRRGLGGGLWHIVRSALSHTLQVTLFIYVVTVVLVAVLETGGESALAAALGGNEFLAVLLAGLVGLIPNCAASVVVTQLYLEGVLSLGAMLAGTLAGAGAGYLVLFRTNHSARENVIILALIWLISVVGGGIIALAA